MSKIHLDLPPDLEQFAMAQAQQAGHANIDAYLVDLLRKTKARVDLDVDLLTALDQLDRGEGRTMSAKDWQDLGGDFCQRHGIADDS
jgi:hypothetical protein